jgi:hypothetical protein
MDFLRGGFDYVEYVHIKLTGPVTHTRKTMKETEKHTWWMRSSRVVDRMGPYTERIDH